MSEIELTGWNVWSTRFVDPPVWTWETPPGVVECLVQVATEKELVGAYRTDALHFDLSAVWPDLAHGPIDMLIRGFDANGAEACTAFYKRFHKVPGFAGDKQAPLDWERAVHDNLAYLLAPARDEVADYEEDMPRSCWSSYEDNVTGERTHLAYPALHHPSFIHAFLTYANQFPGTSDGDEARQQAKLYGDWLLRHRLPKEWTCSLFPYSTIEQGRFEGGIEGKSITLFRAARVGEAMVLLHRVFGEIAYLDYARHLADVFLRLQRADGSWPYRVNPADGDVVEEYTSNAMTPARLFGLLEEILPNDDYQAARQRAADWVLNYPVKTRLWQGMYEDVGEHQPYRNLQHWDTNETIRYALHYRGEIARAVDMAKNLNCYIEDQFVVWQQEESSVIVRCPTPVALEQYLCYYPMEVHTGTWLLSLLALHQATGDAIYLRKGIAAANAIVRGQQESGAFSTWGNDRRFGRPLRTSDWPGCNASAATALMHWAQYYRSLQSNEPFELGLWGI